MEVWKWVYWLIATVGIVGTIALLVIYPAIMAQIVRGIIKLFGLILSYRVGCAIVAAIAVGFAVDYWRHSVDDEAEAERVAVFEKAQDARDVKIAADTKTEVLAEIEAQKPKDIETDKEVKEFHDELPPVPYTGNPFRVGADAVKLRRIAGQTERKPASVKGVPKARRAGGG